MLAPCTLLSLIARTLPLLAHRHAATERPSCHAEWSLFCPNEAPGLADCWGDAFETLYVKYEREGRTKRVIKAQQLWFAILEAQVGSLLQGTLLQVSRSGAWPANRAVQPAAPLG